MQRNWKRTLSLLLAVLLLVGAAPAGFSGLADYLSVKASAELLSGDCGRGGSRLTWSLDTETGTLTVSGTGQMKDYSYASSDEYNAPWIPNSASIRSVVIEYGVTGIGECAFYGCGALTKATIPDSVTRIGGQAFKDCVKLADAAIPSSVTMIDYEAFENCTSLSAAAIPAGVEQLGRAAFKGCTALAAVTIPTGVAGIGSSAFSGCTSLTDVTIPDSVNSIGSAAFSGCTSLAGVTIPKGLNGIADSVFADCATLTGITIPDSATSIGDYAFCRCTSLTGVTIPDSVKEIGEYAFYECANLTSITIPADVSSIGVLAFQNCASLSAITVKTGNAYFCSDECGVLYNKAKTVLIQYPNGSAQTDFAIPDGVTEIGVGAFSACTNLTSLTLPVGVTDVGDWAFAGCTGIMDLTLPVSVKTIGDYAFHDCANLRSMAIPDGMNRIGEWAFSGCTTLMRVTFPYSVTAIEDWTFSDCLSLTSLALPHSVTRIGEHAFNRCTRLAEIHIPSSVTSIDEFAFAECSGLSICNITTNCFAKTFAEENGIEFRVCDGNHKPPCVHAFTSAVTTAPTCTATGERTYTCSLCGDSYTESIPMTAHTPEEVVKPANCQTEGKQFIRCSVCHRQLSEVTVLPKGDHTYEAATTIEATCAEEGECTYTCSVCGDSYTEAVPALDHDWDDGVVTAEPTCQAEGEMLYTCKRCAETKTEAIEIADHSYDAVVTAPTCGAEGYTTFTCIYCGTSLTGETVPATGIHTFGEWTLTKEPANNESGEEQQMCSNCPAVRTRPLVVQNDVVVGVSDEDVNISEEQKPLKVKVEASSEPPATNITYQFRMQFITETNGKKDVEPVMWYEIQLNDKDDNVVPLKADDDCTATIWLPAPSGMDKDDEVNYVILHPITDKNNPSIIVGTESFRHRDFVFSGTTSAQDQKRFDVRTKDGRKYFVFTVTSFSPFIIYKVQDALTVSIRNNRGTTVLGYGETLTLTADVTDLPEGAKIVWQTSSDCVKLQPSADGKTCDVTSVKNGKAAVTVKVVDQNGNTIGSSDNAAREVIESKVTFLYRLIWFFKKLFRIKMTTVQSYRKP